MGVPVLVVYSRRDDRDRRADGSQERRCGARVGTVVTHLENRDRLEQVTLRKQRLDRCLGIAGEERLEGAVSQKDHDRGVVDVVVWQGSAYVGGGREQDLERGWAEVE
jgi:hypothetical protein